MRLRNKQENNLTPLMASKRSESDQEDQVKQYKKWRSVEQILDYKGFTDDDRHYLVLRRDWGFADIRRIPVSQLQDNQFLKLVAD
ncbi:hypothetical protein [Lactiplantibacillus plantarum]|uniref:hypothetical protein n=1 Tax=Lactiplantibacillus plantarum TaxID=1590 RepID=UPI0009767595|nr:hypothetical protein [Lactiplantibacillus plantarum]